MELAGLEPYKRMAMSGAGSTVDEVKTLEAVLAQAQTCQGIPDVTNFGRTGVLNRLE